MPYPDRLKDVERLIGQHKNLERQTLLLAVYFDHSEDLDSVYLLEVISQLGYDEISDDHKLFAMSYGSTEGFRVPSGSRLSILLTNVPEAREAIVQEWADMVPVLEAISQNKYQVLYNEGEGNTVLEELMGAQKKLVAA